MNFDNFVACSFRYPGVDVRLVPDIAFMIGPLVRTGAEKFKYDIVFIARPGPFSEGGPVCYRATVITHYSLVLKTLFGYVPSP